MSSVRTVAIVGGGIAGLATAVALRSYGLEVTVYERAPALTDVGAGISLWPNATRALRRLGALDALSPLAGQIQALNIRDAHGAVLLRTEATASDAPALCAYRPDLIEALRAQLPPQALQPGHTLTAVDAKGAQARLAFAEGSTAEADLVVGADGLHSRVRAYVTGKAPTPVYRGYRVWRGIGPLPTSFVPGEPSESWGDGRRFGLFDVGQGRVYWYATTNRPEHEPGRPPQARQAEVQRLFEGWHDPIGEAIAATPSEAILYGPTYDRQPRRGWSQGRAVLVGDAAHPATPNLGQGGCMALEDGLVLARCLAEASSLSEALASFERARYRRTARVMRQSLWTGRLGQTTGRVARARNAATRLVPGPLFAQRLRWLYQYAAWE
ncbi:MAG: FAD-dependent oxidoreductase [Bacteroidota bacterium]